MKKGTLVSVDGRVTPYVVLTQVGTQVVLHKLPSIRVTGQNSDLNIETVDIDSVKVLEITKDKVVEFDITVLLTEKKK